MMLYALKSVLLFAMFYAVYQLVLKSYKIAGWNRRFLLFSSVMALMLPLFQGFTAFSSKHGTGNENALQVTLQTIEVYANQIRFTELNQAKIILGIYMVGLLWGIVRMILGFLVIRRIKQQSEWVKVGDTGVYFHELMDTPFSFAGNMFIPSQYQQSALLSTIIVHEQAHIRLHHSWDKIYFAIVQALCWFNPFVYLMHREVELLHEFEADEETTAQVNTEEYVEGLLQTVRYQQAPTLFVNHFFNHPIKNRIIMLYKKSQQARFQKSLALSSMLLISFLFLFTQGRAQDRPSKAASTADAKPSETIYESADQMPEFVGGEEELIAYIVKEVKYPEASRKNKIQGKVMVKFVVTATGVIDQVTALKAPEKGEELAKEAIRVVSAMPRWKPGIKQGKPVNVYYVLPVMFSLK